MDQSEIDALLAGGGKPTKKPKAAAKAPAVGAVPAPPPVPPTAPVAEPHKDGSGHVISELDTVTSVTERESNKIMDQLDQISRLGARQQQLITDMMRHEGAQSPGVQKAIHEVMSASKEIQDKVFEAMDLMQFQDITRQKLERIVHHLRQIHDYIVDLLGTGLKSDAERPSISHTIAQTGTTPDENKAHADAVIEAFKTQKKE
jgi:chemotaxis regulatin CheY-phosphate phosphatase CheZ